jgi:hypothetical protein
MARKLECGGFAGGKSLADAARLTDKQVLSL